MDINSSLNYLKPDLAQLEQSTAELEKYLLAGTQDISTKTAVPIIDNLNIDFFEFEDIIISIYGV